MKRSINVIDLENRIQNNLNPSIQCKKETNEPKEEIKSTDRLTPKKQHPSYDYEKALKEYFGDESFDEAEEVNDASFDEEEEDDNYDFNTEYENDESDSNDNLATDEDNRSLVSKF